MKRLLLDIETAPNLAYIWGMWNQNIAPNQINATGYTMCWAAKWYGKRKVYFNSVHKSSEQEMLAEIHELLTEADGVIHYNGTKFDMPTLNRDFIKHDMPPPAPYKQIDLLKTVRSQFRFHSNKLDEVLKALGLQGKVRHTGMELWIDCMAKDPKAWKLMERYNRRDVTIMEGLYEKLLPWMKHHPNLALYVDDENPVCPKCGNKGIVKDGTRSTNTQIYQRYYCGGCHSWLRGRKNITPPEKKGVLVPCHD